MPYSLLSVVALYDTFFSTGVSNQHDRARNLLLLYSQIAARATQIINSGIFEFFSQAQVDNSIRSYVVVVYIKTLGRKREAEFSAYSFTFPSHRVHRHNSIDGPYKP